MIVEVKIPIDGVEVVGISATKVCVRNKFRMALKRVIRAGEKDWE